MKQMLPNAPGPLERRREFNAVVLKFAQSTSGACMCPNYDRAPELPPFFPVLRNMDGIWATMLRICCRNRYIGYLPRVVVHDPEPRQQGDASSDGPGFAEMLIGHFLDLRCLTATESTTGRMEMLGEHLVSLGSRCRTHFRMWVRDMLYTQACLRIAWYQRKLDEIAGHRDLGEQDLRQLIGSLQQRTCKQEFLVPSDFATFKSEEACELIQSLTLDFGRLLRFWPRIVACAVRLNERGQGPAGSI